MVNYKSLGRYTLAKTVHLSLLCVLGLEVLVRLGVFQTLSEAVRHAIVKYLEDIGLLRLLLIHAKDLEKIKKYKSIYDLKQDKEFQKLVDEIIREIHGKFNLGFQGELELESSTQPALLF